jgi:hypothetical protein
MPPIGTTRSSPVPSALLYRAQDFAEIDPSSILPSSRRSTRAQVDYSSAEALKKAGLQEGDDDEENEGDRDVTFDASMQTDDE